MIASSSEAIVGVTPFARPKRLGAPFIAALSRWVGCRLNPPIGACIPLPPVYTTDSFMVKDLWRGIYQIKSKLKDLRVGIYKLICRRNFRINER